MQSFRHVEYPLRIQAGTDSLADLPGELQRLDVSRVLIFTGRTLSTSPLLETLVQAAGSRLSGIYAGVKPHTPRDGAEEAANALRDHDADGIIVAGGGSAVITARAAAIFHAEGHDLDALCTRRIDQKTIHSPRLLKPKVPLVIVPTTPNTAYVKAGAGIFDPQSGERKAVFDPKTRAQSVFLHPGFLMSAPRRLVVSASLDTLLLAVEGLLSAKGDAISDALLMHALRLLSDGLLRLGATDDAALRTDLAMAGIMTGRGTDHAPAGATSALGHAIGANHQIENGVAKAIILPHMLRFNEACAGPGMGRIARALGLREDGDLVGRISDHFGRIFTAFELPSRLSRLGISEADLDAIAERAMNDWFILGNIRPVESPLQLTEILAASL